MATDWSKEQILARIDEVADKYQVPRTVARAVALQESYLNPNAVGDNGKSLGLFQLQRAAAIDAGISPELRHEPGLNIEGGVRFLRQKYDQSGGDWDKALLRYNGGGDPNYVANVRRHMGEKEQPGLLTRAARWLSPGSAEAAELPQQAPVQKKWWETLPPETPDAQAQEAPQAPVAGKKWWETLPPETAPEAPQAPPATATTPQTPPGASVPPAASQEPPAPEVTQGPVQGPPAPPQSTDNDWYRRAYQQEVAPALQPPPPTGSQPTMSEQIAAHERGDLPNDTTPWYQRVYDEWLKPGFETRQTQPGTKEGVLQSVDRLQAQQPGGMFGDYDPGRVGEVAREVAATGIETAAGIAGGYAGSAGGPVGTVTGSVLGQGYGRRVTNQLRLRAEEVPWATIAPGVKIYPSDLANVAFSVVPAIKPLAKQALEHTMAGKAILAANAEFRTAHSAWQEGRKKLLAAEQAGNQRAIADAAVKDQERYATYLEKKQRWDDTVQKNQDTYDIAQQEHIKESRATATANYQQRQAWQAKVQAKQEGLYTSRRERLEGIQADRAAKEQARADTITANQQADQATWRQEMRQDIAGDQDWWREYQTVQERRYGRASQKVRQEQQAVLAKEAQQEWAEGGQEWSIHKARDITERYLPKKPSHELYDRLDKQVMEPDPVTGKPVDAPILAPKNELVELQQNWTKGVDGAPAPLPPAVKEEVDAILAGADTTTFMGVRNAMKRLGPLTRSKDSEVRRAAKQAFGILGDSLEQMPQASNTLKYANKNWQKETLLGDMREWLEPGGGLVHYDDAGREVIRIGGDSGLLTRMEKQVRTNPMWKRAFTEKQLKNLHDEVFQIAGETQMPPATIAPARPELLPGAMANVPGGPGLTVPTPQAGRGLSAATPEPRPLPEVPPSRQPKLLPGAVPDLPESLQQPPAGKGYAQPPVLKDAGHEPPLPRPYQPRLRTATIPEAPERILPESVKKPPGIIDTLKSSGAWGGLAFSLQRMGLPSTSIDAGLHAAMAMTVGGLASTRTNYLLSQALLNPKYRTLNKHFLTMMDNGHAVVDPKLYNVMLAIMTDGEKKEMERELSAGKEKR
jgi:Transglycosylase SLT domain